MRFLGTEESILSYLSCTIKLDVFITRAYTTPMISQFFTDINRFDDYKDYYLKENQEALMLELDMPGFTEEDLAITLEGKQLKIQGERKSGRPVKITREFYLSGSLDTNRVEAELKNGLLLITLPKVEKKRIMVKVV